MLRMASGVQWNEDYLDPISDFNFIYNCIAKQIPNCVLPHMQTLPRAIDPVTNLPAVQGDLWDYSTGEAYLVGLVLQRATGASIGKYLEETVWKPYGMEHDGRWLLDSRGGASFGGIGFNATLRDYGRFAQFVLNNGVLPNGTHALPAGWVRDATTWTAASALEGYADNGQYGYFWWFNPAYDDAINHAAPLATRTRAPLQRTTAANVAPMTRSTADWTFTGLGIFGQGMAINQRENLIVIQWGTWDRPDPVDLAVDPQDPYNMEAVFINALTDALH
jgi:CubicO group peptidase (beta-lactamase class C family)